MSRTLPCLLALLVACAPAASSGRGGAAAPAVAAVLVRVENHNWSDVRVYARRGVGPRTALGDVRAMGTVVFRLPRRLVGDEPVTFDLDPLGGAPIRLGDAVLVHAGQRVDLTLEQDLAMSSAGVRE